MMKDKTKQKELTKGELQVMTVLWDRQHATVTEVLEQLPAPRPAYTTVLTFLRILTEKGFVGFEADGKAHRYHPLIQKGEYSRIYLRSIKDTLFDGSAKPLLSFFAEEENLSASEVQELIDLLQKIKNNEGWL